LRFILPLIKALMKIFTQIKILTTFSIVIFTFLNAIAQSPGQIVRRSSASLVLDFNSDGYVSLPINTGFTTSDITQSEIAFKTIPLAFSEPIGDLATGQSGSFTDLVTSPTDKSGLMAYYDGTNLIFRLRVGSISAGAKGYSILIDADFKAGNSGSQPDPNYVAPTAQGTGNIGFEWEVLLATGNSTTVTIYETDGKIGSNIVQAYQTTNSNNWQIAGALTTNSNNADYFYDFYVPLSAFTGTYAITGTTSFRMVATTVNSPTSALTGSRSDIFGVNDVNYPSTPDGWLAALGGTPPVTLTKLSSGSVGGICSAPPVITSSSITIGSGMSISGTWTRTNATMDANATISVYRYSSAGALLNTYTSTSAYPGGVATGTSWTISGITAASGDYFVAKAKGTSTLLNESECLQSNIIYAACASAINPTVLSQSSLKGICGSLTTGATAALIYKLDATGVTLANSGNANTTYTATTFTWFSCGSGNNISNGTYMIILTGNGCQSSPVFDCISNGSSTLTGLSVNTGITFPATIYPFHTSITGSVPSSASAQSASLFINNMLKSTVSIAANATSYTFNDLQLKANDNIAVYLSPTTGCTTYNTTSVVCYNQPPVITTDANGKLLAGAVAISGTAAANANITLNKTNVTINNWTTTANSSGAWSVTIPALVADDTYTATVTSASGCNTASAASATTTVVAVTTNCPTISNTPVTNTPYTDTSTIVYGTVNVTTTGSIVRLYLDGSLVGSQTLNSAGAQNWSIISSQPFYNGALLKATFQSGASGSEKTDCGTSTVICTSPGTPSISPTSSTIYAGQNITYNVSNVAGSTWYAVQDNSGTSYATSVYTSNTNGFSLNTSNFNSPDTYNLLVSADKLSGCPASTASASVLVNPIVTPVRFITVAAENVSQGIKVGWTVAEEENVSHYQVEKSFDGRNFSLAGSVDFKQAISALNQYSYTDVVVNTDRIYYRIRQVDKDQHYTYSSIVMVKARPGKKIQAWPVPAISEININITANRAQTTAIEILDMNGRKMLSRSIHLSSGNNGVSINQLGKFAKGTYFIKIFADGENHFQKIIIK
jgi:hypothetical protein